MTLIICIFQLTLKQIFSFGDEVDLKDWRSSQSLADLHNHVRPVATKKRSSGKLLLTLFDSLQIGISSLLQIADFPFLTFFLGVSVYSLVTETKKGSAIPIDPETKTPLKRKSVLIGQQTQEVVSPEVRKHISSIFTRFFIINLSKIGSCLSISIWW